MTGAPHTTRCARRVARETKIAGGSDYEVALAVHRHCGLSLLRAHRIACGYTLVEAIEALKEILASRGTPSEGLSHQRLSRWEHEQDMPSPRYLDALCYLYRTRPDRLGFGHDYSDPDPVSENGVQDIMDRRRFVGLAATGAMFISASPTAGLFGEQFDPPGGRRATTSYVELLEELTEQSGYELYTSPRQFIPARMVDLARVQACLLSTTTEDIRRRLYRVFAKNAGLIASRLTDVASAGDTFEWYGIARRAARLSEDTMVQAWIASGTSDACGFHHQFRPGLAAAHAAQSAGPGRASSSAVLGFLAEAAIQARMGRRRESFDAVRNADRMFAMLPDGDCVADGFHISEYLLRWGQASSLTLVGAHTEAIPLRGQVLNSPLAEHDQVGKALMHLDEAAARIDAGELEWGCHTITTTWRHLPSEFHSGLVPQRAVEILDVLGADRASLRHVAEVRELVESSAADSTIGRDMLT
ncbi:helix-turn-helix domain-containing protein [Nocardia alni]|uniref:helix-turn-helix domain-containing protein n=1 Tax=Nocardia alni TaxID=2815723 RepID=UPI001C23F3AA|nr:helix-turn-helix transcriptional regulator [Nocardia alni]